MTPVSDTLHQHAKDDLKRIVEAIERLEEERTDLASDVKDLYSEAKSKGYDAKILRKIVSLRKKDSNQRMEEDLVLATYMHAIGMVQQELPLGDEHQRKSKHEIVRVEEFEDAFA
jgi:uncharacterized protein (UPF0335 family)